MNKEIKLSDFEVIPIYESVKRANISDEEYFGEKYKKYISNSKLSKICAEQGGSMQKYYEKSENVFSSSLLLGTVVHTNVLQPGEFELAPKCGKPTSKLGGVCDFYVKNIKLGLNKTDAFKDACIKANYYVNTIESKIERTLPICEEYYEKVKNNNDNVFVLDDKSWDTATKCINSLKTNVVINNKLNPQDAFMDKLPSFNEDTLFLDFLITYKGRCTKLKMKGKLDNWTTDEESIVCLNDLKTTGHPVNWFMNKEYGSFFKYHYGRQLALYKMMLEAYCQKRCGYNKKTWKFETNILAVETVEECRSKLININDTRIKEGERELTKLLKMVGYYEIFGHKREVKFV